MTKAISMPSYTILVLEGKVAWGSSAVGYILTAVNKNNFEVRGGNGTATRRPDHDVEQQSFRLRALQRRDHLEPQGTTARTTTSVRVREGSPSNVRLQHPVDVHRHGVLNNCIIENCHIHDPTRRVLLLLQERRGPDHQQQHHPQQPGGAHLDL